MILGAMLVLQTVPAAAGSGTTSLMVFDLRAGHGVTTAGAALVSDAVFSGIRDGMDRHDVWDFVLNRRVAAMERTADTTETLGATLGRAVLARLPARTWSW